MKAGLALAVLVLAAPAARAQDPLRITMARTACFGTCPAYTVTLRADASVSYEGTAHVRVSGAHRWTIDPIAVLALARDIEKAGFFEMNDEYTAPVTDLPRTTVTVVMGARAKTVKDYYGAPAALKQIEAQIDKVSGALHYVRPGAALARQMRLQGWRATDDEAMRWMVRAVASGDAETVKALLDAGADARAADADGVTLMMRAAEAGDPETLRALRAAGGDPTARDKQGRNAADRARDGMRDDPRTPRSTVEATGRPRDYAAILRLLTDE
jgi:Domain of unknown function (DUF6438)/Ankyrin repeats (3 copies)